MNQEQNNLNPNNFNPQGNNGIPNIQPLNSQNFNNTSNQSASVNQPTFNPQPQPTPSFQQPINQINIQESTPQPMNSFESGNASNQNFNSKPPKKMNLGLIIGIVVAIAVVSVGIVFGSKLLSNSGNNNSLNNENQSNNNVEKEEITNNVNKIVYGGKTRVQHGNWYTLFNVPTKYIVNHAYPDKSESGYSYIDSYGYRALETTGSLSLETDGYSRGESGISVYISFGEIGADKPDEKFKAMQNTIEYSRKTYPDTYETTEAIMKTINGKTVVYYIERNHPYDKCSKVTGYMFFSSEQLNKWSNEDKMKFYINISYTNYEKPEDTIDNLYFAFEEIVNSYDGNYYHSYGQENADYTIEK